MKYRILLIRNTVEMAGGEIHVKLELSLAKNILLGAVHQLCNGKRGRGFALLRDYSQTLSD